MIDKIFTKLILAVIVVSFILIGAIAVILVLAISPIIVAIVIISELYNIIKTMFN